MKAPENVPTLNTAAICERLKQVRIQVCGPRGQSHFAALLNLSPSTYNYYEKGRIPPVDVLDRAATMTGAPLLWLIRGEPAEFALESLQKIEAADGGSGDGRAGDQSHLTLANRCELHDPAEIHHRDTMADALHHSQVVRDEEIGEAVLVLQIHQQVYDLRLNGHVERGDRFVGDDQFGRRRHGARNGNALALAAGKLMRQVVGLISAKPDPLEQRIGSPPLFRSLCNPVRGKRLRYDLPGSLLRIERRIGILKDHLHMPSQRPQSPFGHIGNVPAQQLDPPPGWLMQPKDCLSYGRFSAAAFSDQAECLAGADGERHAIDGTHRCGAVPEQAGPVHKLLGQAPDLGRRHLPGSNGSFIAHGAISAICAECQQAAKCPGAC